MTARTTRISRWGPAIATLVALAVLAALIVYWAMQLMAPAVTIAPSGSLVKMSGAIDTSASRRLFGDASNKPATLARRASVDVKVNGVLASDYRAAAILSIDGQPAKAYGVGEEIEEDFFIESITSEEVVLDRDGEEIRVDVPEANRDISILTSGKNDDGATAAPASTSAVRQGNRVNANSRSRVRRPGARRGTSASRPALQPRRLPPSGAAAAAASARNTTTGAIKPNTPAAARPAGVGRPGPANARGTSGSPRTTAARPSTVQPNVGQPNTGQQNPQNAQTQTQGQAQPQGQNGQQPQ
jgi:general secretion pathway protein C